MGVFTFCIGLVAQGFFSARILVQWLLSERSRKVLSPTVFWVFSLVGSAFMFYYGWLRDDFSIIFGQFLSFYIYIVNLHYKGGRVKADIALAKGKAQHDKRETEKKRDWEREKGQLMRHASTGRKD